MCINNFPEHKEAMVGYIEAVTGIGLILGPLLGTGLYALGGYTFVFYSVGVFFSLCSVSIKFMFPPEIDIVA